MINPAQPYIVRSLLETDLYKFTMWQAFLHSHPAAMAEYAFFCRNTPAYPLANLKAEVDAELDHLCTMSFAQDELDYLRSLRFIKSDFVDFLSLFRFQRRFIETAIDGDNLRVVARGPLVHVMGFEIFVLYIINELYYRKLDNSPTILDEARARLAAKVGFLKQESAILQSDKEPFIFFDFGLRRRYSAAWHEEVVQTFAREVPEHFRGTSNVLFAKKYGLTAIGTMAHEYLQAFQSFGYRLRDFQKAALEGWVQEYRGDLGVALTDVVGMDAFLSDFDLYFAKLYDGLRHDSGEPNEWAVKAINHYKSLNIDPMTKRLVFSDALNLPRAVALYRNYIGRALTAYGIGTDLSNDTPLTALNIVMKIMACNDQSVAKLSDSPGKTLCEDQTYLAYLRQVFAHPEVSA